MVVVILQRARESARAPQSVFATRLAGRDNAIGLLRLLFAAMVLVSHAFPIGGFGLDPLGSWSGHQVELGTLGLYGFFALSGYLVTNSARGSDSLAFLWRRVLRLFPAFVVVLVVSALVVGPLAQIHRHGDLAGYWGGADGAVNYIIHNLSLSIHQFGIHDVFRDDPYGAIDGSVINGSLWTLWYEFRAYLAIGLLAALGLLGRARWVVPVSALLVLAGIPLFDHWSALRPFIGQLIRDAQGMELLAVFLVGASIATYECLVPCHPALAGLAAVLAVGTALTGGFMPVGMVAFAYLTLYAAAVLPGWARRVGRRNDISYGVYLYAWPVQALLATYGVNELGFVPYLVVTAGVVALLGWLSWRLVEEPALRLKGVGPGRGWACLPLIGRHIARRRVIAMSLSVLLLAASTLVV